MINAIFLSAAIIMLHNIDDKNIFATFPPVARMQLISSVNLHAAVYIHAALRYPQVREDVRECL